MSRVIADMSMSLDGFVADPCDGVEDLFGWYANGSVETPTANPGVTFRTSPASAHRLYNIHNQPAGNGTTEGEPPCLT